MKRFVVEQNGKLSIVCTSGQEPAGALCEARAEWEDDLISYDHVSNVVFIDPHKIKERENLRLKEKWAGESIDFIDSLEYWGKLIYQYALGFAMGAAFGYFLF